MVEGDEFETAGTVSKLAEDRIILEFATVRRMIVCESGTVTFLSDPVPLENLVRNDTRWRYGNEAADGRVF